MKCKYNYKLKKRVCKRDSIIKNINGGVTEPNRNVRYLAIVTMAVLVFIAIVNISDWETIKPLLLSFFILTFGIAIYSLREYQDDLIGWAIRETPINLLYAIFFSLGFVIVSSFVPFFSLAYPYYPAAVGESLNFVLLVIVTPIMETIFFQASIFAFFRNFLSKNKFTPFEKYGSIILVSIIFALFHLGAYITGLYSLSLEQAITAFNAKSSAFVTAFIFSVTAMIFALRRGVERAEISFIIFFHMGLNFAAYSLSVVKFV